MSAMAESSRREVRAGVSKSILEQSEMDLANLRVGKQRLVSKKKRMSALGQVVDAHVKSFRVGCEGMGGWRKIVWQWSFSWGK